jgi:hypothetical protein
VHGWGHESVACKVEERYQKKNYVGEPVAKVNTAAMCNKTSLKNSKANI